MSKKEMVEEILMGIYEQDGALVPERIVEQAREKAHPLHPYFEWDNRKAGEQYRLLQATQMIRTVEVRIITADEEYKVRAFHPMRYVGREGPGYLHERDIASQERPVLLRIMQRDWQSMRRRFGHMQEFWALVSASQEQQVG